MGNPDAQHSSRGAQSLRARWSALPRGARWLARAKGFAVLACFGVAVVVGTMAPNRGYEQVAFALPAESEAQPWRAEVDHFASKVSKAFGVRVGTAKEFSGWILEASERHDFSPELIASLVLTESSFRKGVRSSVGAIGPAQVRPEFWRRFCGNPDLSDPAENIYCGVQVLAHYRDSCGGEDCALKAYNVGPKSRRVSAAERYLSKIGRGVSILEATQVEAL